MWLKCNKNPLHEELPKLRASSGLISHQYSSAVLYLSGYLYLNIFLVSFSSSNNPHHYILGLFFTKLASTTVLFTFSWYIKWRMSFKLRRDKNQTYCRHINTSPLIRMLFNCFKHKSPLWAATMKYDLKGSILKWLH